MRRLSVPILLMLVLALPAVGPATAQPPESVTGEWEDSGDFECDEGFTWSWESRGKYKAKNYGDRVIHHENGGMRFWREDTGDFDYEPWTYTEHIDWAEETLCLTGTFFHLTLPGEGIILQDAGRICWSPITYIFAGEEPTFSAGSHEFFEGIPDTFGIDYRTYCEEWAD